MVERPHKQRRERDKQEMREAILAAARAIAAQDGWQAVTIRKVAERIEYSPPMLYQYFESKDALLLALLREGFSMIATRLRAAQREALDAEDALRRVAAAYRDFAWEHPELYQVMHGLGGVPFGSAETPSEARDAFDALRDVARPLMTAALDLDLEVELLWGTLHGLVALTMDGRLAGGRPRATLVIERAVRSLILAWRETKR